jgi:DedD protein
MFATRSGSQGNPTPPASQSIEAVRRRARHRLIGAAVLVLLGVIGFSLLFDTQPRPISVDIPIEIPAKNQTPSLGDASMAEKPAEKPEAKAEVRPEPKSEAPRVAANESLGAREEVVEPAARPAPEPAAVPETKPASKSEPTPKTDDAAKAKAAAAEAARAKALLEGKSASKPDAAKERVVVQVGAFAEAAGARTVRLKLERAGLKTYTHVAETAEGKRIRVRLGPFDSRAEAEKAAARVKALGLPAAILTL